MIENIINYEDLNENNCFFVPQAGFAYSNINEKYLATLNVFSCVGIYLKQNNVQILAHLDCEPKRHLREMLDYLYNKNIIKNDFFEKAIIIESSKSSQKNSFNSFEYLQSFIKKVDIIKKNYNPLNFGFDISGNFYEISCVSEKTFSFEQCINFISKRFAQKKLICKNHKIEI
jgi:hypothetical protein